MTQHQGTDQFFFILIILFGKDHHRKRGRYSLITTAGITHDRNHSSCHSSVTSGRSIREDVREYAVTHHFVFITSPKHSSQRVSVIAFKGLFGSCLVQTCRIKNKTNFIQRSCQGKIINLTQVQFGSGRFLFFIGCMLLV